MFHEKNLRYFTFITGHLPVRQDDLVGVESNRTERFKLTFLEFFELKMYFQINRIENYRIFRTFFAFSNQSNRKFSNRIQRILLEFQFDSTSMTWKQRDVKNITLHHRTCFEHVCPKIGVKYFSEWYNSVGV